MSDVNRDPIRWERSMTQDKDGQYVSYHDYAVLLDSHNRLRAELAEARRVIDEARKQEPVGEVCHNEICGELLTWIDWKESPNDMCSGTKLYAAPMPAQPAVCQHDELTKCHQCVTESSIPAEVARAVQILRQHNQWRRGADNNHWQATPYSPAELGRAIDTVCDHVTHTATPDVLKRATEYAHDIVTWLHRDHYADNARFEPFGDLLGLLSQIDNMICGWKEPAQPAVVLPTEIEEVLACLGDDIDTLRAENEDCEIAANMRRAHDLIFNMANQPAAQPADDEPRLWSYAENMSTCTLSMRGEHYEYNRVPAQPAVPDGLHAFNLFVALNYAVKQVPELASVPGIRDSLAEYEALLAASKAQPAVPVESQEIFPGTTEALNKLSVLPSKDQP